MTPAPYKMEREQEKPGADGKPVLDKDGEPVKEVVEVKVDSPEANQPAGYIEITPPVDMSCLKADTLLAIAQMNY